MKDKNVKCLLQHIVPKGGFYSRTKEIHQGNTDFFPMSPTEYGRFLVSLGTWVLTGSAKCEQKYHTAHAAKWGILGWLTGGGSYPLVDVFTQAIKW